MTDRDRFWFFFVWLIRLPALKRARVRFRTSRKANVVLDALTMKFVTARKLLCVKNSQFDKMRKVLVPDRREDAARLMLLHSYDHMLLGASF